MGFGDGITAEALVQLAMAKVGGAPVSRETMHAHMRQKGMTTMSYEEEMDAIELEQG